MKSERLTRLLQAIAGILGAVLTIISAVQHNGNPIAGTDGLAGLTSLLVAFGFKLHHDSGVTAGK